jgi:RNA polymerase sigma-70 factor (ECF subfamily)
MKFETIYKTYWQKVFRLYMGCVNNIDAAKDLAQEIFIQVWKQLPKFRNESSIVFQAVYFKLRNSLRYRDVEELLSLSVMKVDHAIFLTVDI